MFNKRALSQVVTYVLLIVVAIGLSVIVFNFLSGIVPQDQFSCPDGISLVIKDVSCEGSGKVSITFQNKGNFNIDGVYSRYSSIAGDATSKDLIPIDDDGPDGNPGTSDDKLINKITEDQANLNLGFLYFGRSYLIASPLRPNQEYTQLFSFTGSLEKLEIQPFLNLEDEREVGICEDKIVSRTISCS
jgi:hypothetical protein